MSGSDTRPGGATASPRSLVSPFAGLRPGPGKAARVIAPPYDVVSTEEARQWAEGNPWSFFHVSRPEIDLPPGAEASAPEAYAKAAESFTAMQEAGILKRDPGPCFYVYRLTMGNHAQTGLVAAASLAAYSTNRIRRHESTNPDKVADRARQIKAVNAQTGPVMVVHRSQPTVDGLLNRAAEGPPDLEATLDGGVVHAIWVLGDGGLMESLAREFDAMDALYIADGHHRSAAAARVAEERRAANPSAGAEASYNSVLVVSFPDDQVQILDYNRVVRDLGGLDADAFLGRVGESFTVEARPDPFRPGRRGEFGLYVDGRWYSLALSREPPPPGAAAVSRLDINLLGERLLEPVLGIVDPTLDSRIDFIGGIRGLEELERRVDSGEMAAAFALFPTGIEDLLAVADAGDFMPAKSTWFEPKLADGLVSMVLD